MDVRVFEEAEPFAALASSCLAVDPFSTNVIGVTLAGVLDGSRAPGPGELWVAVVEDAQVVGLAMHTPPRHLFLSRMPAAAAEALAEELHRQQHRHIDGVNGEVSAVTAYSDAWTALTGRGGSVETRTRMYRLRHLVVPSCVPGTARMAGPGDEALVTEWFGTFHREAIPHQPDDDIVGVVRRRLLAGQVWLWVDRTQPVSLAASSAPAAGVARIGPVFTSRRHRRHGYGAAVTARATQAAVDAGAAQVVLYTDLANPTSNAIYQAIGYVADHDGQERGFRSPQAA